MDACIYWLVGAQLRMPACNFIQAKLGLLTHSWWQDFFLWLCLSEFSAFFKKFAGSSKIGWLLSLDTFVGIWIIDNDRKKYCPPGLGFSGHKFCISLFNIAMLYFIIHQPIYCFYSWLKNYSINCLFNKNKFWHIHIHWNLVNNSDITKLSYLYV